MDEPKDFVGFTEWNEDGSRKENKGWNEDGSRKENFSKD
jgi:hypothetical protein